jgi:hypothetical protein
LSALLLLQLLQQKPQLFFPESIKLQKDSEGSITAFSTETEQIYKAKDNQYYFYDDVNNVYPVKRFDIDLSKIKEGNSNSNVKASRLVDELLMSYDLPQEIYEDIQNTVEKIKAGEITVEGVAIYVPELNHEVQPAANHGDTKHSLTHYYNVDTTYKDVKTGSSTYRVAESFTDVIFDVAGYNNYVAAFNSGLTALQAFFNAVGPQTITGNYQDKFQLRVVYDKIDKWTYVYNSYNNAWLLGAKTQQGTVNKIDSLQYYWISSINTGKSAELRTNPYKTYRTPNFLDPDYIARQFAGGGGGPWEEFVIWRIPGTSVNLIL